MSQTRRISRTQNKRRGVSPGAAAVSVVAAIAAVKRELGGASSAFVVAVFQTAVAWVAAFGVYRIGLLLVH